MKVPSADPDAAEAGTAFRAGRADATATVIAMDALAGAVTAAAHQGNAVAVRR